MSPCPGAEPEALCPESDRGADRKTAGPHGWPLAPSPYRERGSPKGTETASGPAFARWVCRRNPQPPRLRIEASRRRPCSRCNGLRLYRFKPGGGAPPDRAVERLDATQPDES